MIEANETKTCNTSRRTLIKSSATVAGLATISPAISLAGSKTGKGVSVEKNVAQVRSDQQQYIVSVLNKYAAKSKRVSPVHIDRFAKGFTEMNGDIDYRNKFKNLDGEYRLVKLFIKSLNAST